VATAVAKIAAPSGVTLEIPVAAISGPDGAVYILDQGAKRVYRIGADRRVDSIGRAGAGPGELSNPSDIVWLENGTLGVVDAGNSRIQRFTPAGAQDGVIPFPFGPTSVAVGFGDTIYAPAFARSFALGAGGPEVKEKGLVTLVSGSSGSVLTEFVKPRPYKGEVVPLFGNAVSAAVDRVNRAVWVAWPLEPVLMKYSPEGVPLLELKRTLEFTPPVPTEYRAPNSPMPSADYQRVTYGLAVDAKGALLLLAPREAKKGRIGDRNYTPPPQQLEVYENGALRCRIPLPVTGSSLTSAAPGTVLIVDGVDTPEVFKVNYHC
jgi:hypothetical protein